MIKKIIASVTVGAMSAIAPVAITHADPRPDVPACTVYVSDKQVPVSGFCEPYYYQGILLFNGIEVNT